MGSACLRIQSEARRAMHTNGADDRGAAELSLGLVLGVELRQPFDPGPARVEVGNSVGHCV